MEAGSSDRHAVWLRSGKDVQGSATADGLSRLGRSSGRAQRPCLYGRRKFLFRAPRTACRRGDGAASSPPSPRAVRMERAGGRVPAPHLTRICRGALLRRDRGLLHIIARKADAAEHAETWRQKSVRVLVVNVGNVVDPAEQLKLIVECIFGAEVDDGVAGGRDRHACVSVDIGPIANVEEGARQSEWIDRIPERCDAELFLWSAEQLQPGVGVNRSRERVVRANLHTIDHIEGHEVLGAFGDRVPDIDVLAEEAAGYRLEKDQVGYVVLEVGRSKPDTVVEERLL